MQIRGERLQFMELCNARWFRVQICQALTIQSSTSAYKICHFLFRIKEHFRKFATLMAKLYYFFHQKKKNTITFKASCFPNWIKKSFLRLQLNGSSFSMTTSWTIWQVAVLAELNLDNFIRTFESVQVQFPIFERSISDRKFIFQTSKVQFLIDFLSNLVHSFEISCFEYLKIWTSSNLTRTRKGSMRRCRLMLGIFEVSCYRKLFLPLCNYFQSFLIDKIQFISFFVCGHSWRFRENSELVWGKSEPQIV